MFKGKNFLIVAAHPDDEMLGCAGTIAKLHEQGWRGSILILGEGPISRRGAEGENVRRYAQACAIQAAELVHVFDVHFALLPDNRFDAIPLIDIIRQVEDLVEEIRPDVIFTHHIGDLNIDHQLTHKAVMTACRPLPGTNRTILTFEVPSSTEYSTPGFSSQFCPNIYIDISIHLKVKISALRCYESEMRHWPHPRSYEGVEYLARLRGSQCGCDAAEAFMLCRGVF